MPTTTTTPTLIYTVLLAPVQLGYTGNDASAPQEFCFSRTARSCCPRRCLGISKKLNFASDRARSALEIVVMSCHLDFSFVLFLENGMLSLLIWFLNLRKIDLVNRPFENTKKLPLFHCLKDEMRAIAEVLLQHGASPTRECPVYRFSPLNYAVSTSQPETVKLLLSHGAAVGGKWLAGSLCSAIQCGNVAIVQSLLDAGADPTLFGSSYCPCHRICHPIFRGPHGAGLN